ncbi:hypothetical protein DVA67_019645 [Solirubrobacter sp. CPCC 204708]|uniref:Uncharacterized protein n=1 Tax=Solirubrobacter deserti TaxID=2282478 RepID=A0ABT4RG12_9ACTN|nr:hypothetical protein [Solirubrobacter deserti]MBE2318205.1 hypothetical protein [Solirubrobacter deserti]MDA0137486.1 hypothetical protein [Solirubrobacter deserti]
MALNVNGASLAPARYTPPTPPPVNELTARDMAAATRLGLQAVPVRNTDPVTGPAKREKRGETNDEKRAAEDADRLDMLRLMAFKRDIASVLSDRDRT